MGWQRKNLEALHQHWLTADSTKQFAFALVDEHSEPEPEVPSDQLDPALLRLSAWYALTYIVIEGYQEQDIKDPTLERMLSEHQVLATLRALRMSLFDFRLMPFSPAILGFLRDKTQVLWILHLNSVLRRFFEQHLPSAAATGESPVALAARGLDLTNDIPAAPLSPALPAAARIEAPSEPAPGNWRQHAASDSYSDPEQFLAKCLAVGSNLSSKSLGATPYFRKIWCAAHFAHTFATRIAPCAVALATKDELSDFNLKVKGEFYRFQIAEVAEPVSEHLSENTRLGAEIEDEMSRATRIGVDWIRNCISSQLQKSSAVADMNLLLRIGFVAAYHDFARIRSRCQDLLKNFASVWLLKENALCCLHATSLRPPLEGWIEIIAAESAPQAGTIQNHQHSQVHGDFSRETAGIRMPMTTSFL